MKRSSKARERIEDHRQMKMSSVSVWNIWDREGECGLEEDDERANLFANRPDPDGSAGVFDL